ncbi:MAG: DUF6502 family protein [Pseudomonadota bacterium]
MTDGAFEAAIRRILRPLVRAMIARGLFYPRLTEILKEVFVGEAEAHFGIAGRQMTDSRISVLTGLQRRDIRGLRGADDVERPRGLGPVPRTVAHWQGDPRYQVDGAPAPLPRLAEAAGDGPSFESLVREIGRDVHARTILDELSRLGLVTIDKKSDRVSLIAEALLPSRDDALLLGYYAANLGDHAAASAANLMASPDPGPFYERAVHYNRLRAEDVDALEASARERLQDALAALNADALSRQRAAKDDPAATARFRAGAFVFRAGEGNRDDDAPTAARAVDTPGAPTAANGDTS